MLTVKLYIQFVFLGTRKIFPFFFFFSFLTGRTRNSTWIPKFLSLISAAWTKKYKVNAWLAFTFYQSYTLNQLLVVAWIKGREKKFIPFCGVKFYLVFLYTKTKVNIK